MHLIIFISYFQISVHFDLEHFALPFVMVYAHKRTWRNSKILGDNLSTIQAVKLGKFLTFDKYLGPLIIITTGIRKHDRYDCYIITSGMGRNL